MYDFDSRIAFGGGTRLGTDDVLDGFVLSPLFDNIGDGSAVDGGDFFLERSLGTSLSSTSFTLNSTGFPPCS